MNKFEIVLWMAEKKYGELFLIPLVIMCSLLLFGLVIALVYVIAELLSPWLLLIFPIAFILIPAYMLYKVWNEESS